MTTPYQEGYSDGYAGEDSAAPWNHEYMEGYWDGVSDRLEEEDLLWGDGVDLDR